MRVQYQRQNRAKTMITKEIRIAKTEGAKRASPVTADAMTASNLPSSPSWETGDTAAGAREYEYISFRAEFLFWRPSWWEKSTSEKITVISAEYISGKFITHLKSIIHMHAWHLISINCWKWGSGVAKIDFFFHLPFYYTCWPRYFTTFGKENNSYEIGKIWKKPLPAEIHLAQHLMA